VSTQVQFFCVGDDWQAINAFAGSSLRYFSDFEHYFERTARRVIRTNYRSPRLIVRSGNALMRGRGIEAQADRTDDGHVWLCRLDQFEPRESEIDDYGVDDLFTPAVERIMRRYLDRGLGVAILARKNDRLPWGPVTWRHGREDLRALENHLQKQFPEERQRITVTNVHKYKGRQEDVVIIADAVETCYPLIHPQWLFSRVLGDTLEQLVDEERRLFYVALTRARHCTVLVTDWDERSLFIDDVARTMKLEPIRWAKR
jgi:DNA helicase-4